MASIRYLKDRGRWWVRWRATNRQSGAVFKGSQVFLEKAEAVRTYAEMEAQEKLWRSGQVESLDSIDRVRSEFDSYCKRHTATTQKFYRYVMGDFIASLPKNVQRIQQLDAKHIEAYLYARRDTGVVNRTLNSNLTVLKAFYRYFSERYSLPNHAAKVTMLTEDPPESRFLTQEEYEKLLAAADELARDRIVFLANTGLRASEFCAVIRAKHLTPESTAVTVTGKGRRRRTVPLNQNCRAVLARSHIYRPTGRNPLYQQLARVAKRAKIPPLGPHSLRHYFATQLLLRGVPIVKVAELCGHSVRVCEETYKHFLPIHLQGVTDALDEPYVLVKERR